MWPMFLRYFAEIQIIYFDLYRPLFWDLDNFLPDKSSTLPP